MTPVLENSKEDTMRTLAITENITLDGSIEMVKDWFDPQSQGDSSKRDLLEEQQRQGNESDALLVGRRTFEAFREYWPRQTDDTTGIADYLNQVQKYVVSSTLTNPAWEKSTVLSGNPVEKVTALKQKDGKDVVLTGSITLAHSMIEAGLVDEYRLFVYPTVQGCGRRLFPDGYEVARLRLLDSKAFRKWNHLAALRARLARATAHERRPPDGALRQFRACWRASKSSASWQTAACVRRR